MAAEQQSPLAKLFGNTLLGKDGKEVQVSSLADKEAIGVYFSAHWCPPCRGFTPKLVEYYKKMKAAGKNFEIVFVSSDRDEKSFEDYYAEMPWLALKFSDRKRKGKLSKKFGVNGIPSFQIVNPATGKVTNAEGRAIVSSDPEGNDFPWTKEEKNLFDVLADVTFKGKDGNDKDLATLRSDNKYLMFYFSAHWCPPCRGFTPKFAEWYKKNQPALANTDRSFEVIFVSSDRDEGAFESYWKEQPWLALPYPGAGRELKATVSDIFGVQGIPTLTVVDTESGKTITDSGRAGVSSDEDAKEFPWPKKSIEFLAGPNIDPINSTPMFIAFAKGADNAEAERVLAQVKTVADEYMQRAKAEDEDMEIEFRVDKGCDFTDRIKGLVPDLKDNTVAIVDISSRSGKVGFASLADITTDAVRDFCAAFEKETDLVKLSM